MLFIRFNRSAVAAFAFSLLALPGSLLAQTPDHPSDNSARFPTPHDLKAMTMSGSYLAARHASVERDSASAAAFYRSALRIDPKNNELLDRAFISSLADGDIDEAVKLADRILTIDKSNRVARLVVGVRDLKMKKYSAAQSNINQSVRGPITDLVATLLSGWATYGAGDTKAAVAKAALGAGASIVNDISASSSDKEMGAAVAESGAAYICMHMQGTPQTMQLRPHYQDVAAEVREFFFQRIQRLKDCGIRAEQLILDPGIGFGKTLEHNLELLRA